MMSEFRSPVLLVLMLFLSAPFVGTIQPEPADGLDVKDIQLLLDGLTTEIPNHAPLIIDERPWWMWTALDSDRNGIHDSLQTLTGAVGIGLSYDHEPSEQDLALLQEMGYSPNWVIPAVDAVLLGVVDAQNITELSQIDGVVMVERYGTVVFYGDIQTMAVKARNSTDYPESAWQLGVSGKGVNIALTDTGVDSEHPGLEGKHVAGFDAVCFVHTDLHNCALAGGRETDGSFDPDDGNQHGTACMGMAAATGMDADGTQSEFYGSAPNASLVDVRIGTDVGAGPFENYVLEQEFYESAMNGLQWIIDNKDTAWPGVDESLHGIDIISLSWGITSHEGGGSDGEDMHSRILNEATIAGVTVSNAAGNDGDGNDGLSGMSSSSLSITVGATDDQNTVSREDDTVAGYSSRGPRRDNGDGDPINELIPEISAPGSDIIQAEGCVTDGGCHNDIPGQDASDNTYTGRGSGTSYATPSVTGVIALMMEANPDLDPMAIKEVLKQTAERKGSPSAPEVDPYWNRDFGYGMVDARAAVELAIHLGETGQSESIDWTLQNHLLNRTTSNGKTIISGHAWTQSVEIERVEFRIGDSKWVEATYEETDMELSPLTPFNWTVALDEAKLPAGENTVEIRVVSAAEHSLPVIVTVYGNPSGDAISGDLTMALAALGLIIILIATVGLIVIRSQVELLPDDILEAEIIHTEPDEDFSSLTVAQLKEILIEKGLPTSGKKTDLIDRLQS